MTQIMKAVRDVVCSFLSTSFLLFSVWGDSSTTTTTTEAKPYGLTMGLIHIHSPASPLYPGNISYTEKIRRLVNQSAARAQHLDFTISSALNTYINTNQTMTNDLIRPKLQFQLIATYTIQVGLGTFDEAFPADPFKSFYLYIDTGSSLLWNLCEDCQKPPNECFHTKAPPYPNSQSKSYKPLPCGRHPLCKPGQCVGDFCSQDITYLSSSAIRETFHFLSTSGQTEPIEGIVFGCAYDAKNTQYDWEVSGVLGLGYTPNSFPVQISNLIQGAFSFCLCRDLHTTTYLRFGADIPQPPPGSGSVTPLVLLQDIPYYYVNLQGISVDEQRLQIDPSVFAIRKQGQEGGCVMDNGSTFTSLIRPAYDAVIAFLESYFSKIHDFIRAPSPSDLKLDLCYKWSPPPPLGFEDLPPITFHFENNANLEIAHEDGFIELDGDTPGNEVMCLAIMPNDVRTIIGSLQQANYRFIYDLNGRQLKFTPEDCDKNS
ncbi:hypothetical protein ACFX14_008291 [Malus domestica]